MADRFVVDPDPDPVYMGSHAIWDRQELQVVGRAMSREDAQKRCDARNRLASGAGHGHAQNVIDGMRRITPDLTVAQARDKALRLAGGDAA